jgi:hypothetical protein
MDRFLGGGRRRGRLRRGWGRWDHRRTRTLRLAPHLHGSAGRGRRRGRRPDRRLACRHALVEALGAVADRVGGADVADAPGSPARTASKYEASAGANTARKNIACFPANACASWSFSYATHVASGSKRASVALRVKDRKRPPSANGATRSDVRRGQTLSAIRRLSSAVIAAWSTIVASSAFA